MVPGVSGTCTDQQLPLLTAFTAGCLLQQPLQCSTAFSARAWGLISSQNLYFKTSNLLHGVFFCPLTRKKKTPSHDQQNSTILNCRLQQAPQLSSANLHLFFLTGLILNSIITHHQGKPDPLQMLSHLLGQTPTNYRISLHSCEMLLLPCPARLQTLSFITYSGSAPRPWEAMPLHPVKDRALGKIKDLPWCHAVNSQPTRPINTP